MSTVLPAIRAAEAALRARFVERDPVIHGLFVALAAQEHVVLLGPPGTAKTWLVQSFADAIQRRFWSTLLTRFATPEDVFGPLSVQGLQADRYTRVATGRLPEAEVVLLDEIFKSNASLLNALLPVLNERVWFDDGQRRPLPLQLLVGASNEWPADDDDLAAVRDRFALRFVLEPIVDPDAWTAWMTAAATPDATPPALPVVPATACTTLQAATRAVDARPIVPLLGSLRLALTAHGIAVSDRRWRTALRLIQAEAALAGRPVARPADVLILADSLWTQPAERPAVRRLVAEAISPVLADLIDALDGATETYTQWAQVPPDSVQAPPREQVLANLQDALARVRTHSRQAAADGLDLGPLADAATRIQAYLARVQAA